MTAEEYRALLDVDFDDVKLEEMRDIKDIRIDKNLPLEERTKQYFRKVGNPYLVRCGDMKVKIRFAGGGVTFEEAFENMLMTV